MSLIKRATEKTTESGKDLSWRLKPPKLERRGAVSTGCAAFDELVGGLPAGLTTFYGLPGSGKTTLALHISLHDPTRVLYVITERIESRIYELWSQGKLRVANYSAYRPKWDRFAEEIVKLAKQLGAEILIVDSLTAVFNWESEIRGPVMQFSSKVSNEGLAVVGISQARGAGNVAGGYGVLHASTLVLRFDKILIDASWLVKRYKVPEGSYIWTIRVEKDAEGRADQNTEWIYEWTGKPLLSEPRFVKVTALD